MDVSALGRQLFHNAQLHKAYSIAFTAAGFGIDGFPTHGNQLVGHKHFDDSDYTIHRSKDWMASLKMSSSRVIGTEVVNEDNHLGYYLGDGATYYYCTGDEYLNVFPFWDWRKIPGVTAYEDTTPIPNIRQNKSRNRSSLVGGLTHGNRGVSAMALDRDGLTGRKTWLFTDDFVLNLGTGISTDSLLAVTTAIEGRVKAGDLRALSGNQWRTVVGSESFPTGEARLFHASTGYVVIPGDTLVVEAGTRTGDWSDNMKMYRASKIQGDVVAMHLRHGVSPKDASYHYYVMPATTPEAVEKFNPASCVKIHRNDRDAQIIETLGESPELWAVVYTPGNITRGDFSFTADAPGIYHFSRSASGEWSHDSRSLFRI